MMKSHTLTGFFKMRLFCREMRKAVRPNCSLSFRPFFHQASHRVRIWSCRGASETGRDARTAGGGGGTHRERNQKLASYKTRNSCGFEMKSSGGEKIGKNTHCEVCGPLSGGPGRCPRPVTPSETPTPPERRHPRQPWHVSEGRENREMFKCKVDFTVQTGGSIMCVHAKFTQKNLKSMVLCTVLLYIYIYLK